MPRIFISYRRDDSAFVAQPIYEKLKERFGEESVIYDREFPLGVDFAKKIDEAVGECDVLLAVIGDRWLSIRFEDGPMKGQRRLDDPNDYVRLEIASALKRDIPVIPVLVGKVSMPDVSQGLLADLAELTRKQAASVRAGRDLANDLQLLVRGVKRALKLPPLTPSDLALPPGVKVVPQGLRSFDEKDNGFFTYLLPGPYQDDGLPEKLCFWKTRIEETDAESTFRVGLIYGPSGCGKSSLVKAGLLPRLCPNVTVVYVEATATDTEATLLAALHKHCPYLASESSLKAALGRKDKIPSDKKVLIVLDQFEQYLHSTPEDEQDELAEALRECDGGKLQCLLMVRDDFLTPITRFMNRLQIPLNGDRNIALVDLFDNRHAKKVLALLGQAYGGLPKSGRLTKEQDAFLNQAVSELADGDHVISVRLALFAQMVKDKEWKPATLKEVGGATGVGVAFLEDSFVAKSAPENQRHYRVAAQRVLGALLPEPGTTIKGAMRTRQELLKKSGYARRPTEFDQVIEVLDKKLRLVTPTEAVVESSDGQSKQSADGEKRYQLTHDYLVPSLRDWLTSKQRETRKGRAELRLAERSTAWNDKPENRHLPSLWEYLNIQLLTENKDWTASQRKTMRQAGRVHGIRSGVVAATLVVLLVGAWQITGRFQAAALVGQLVADEIGQVPGTVDKLAGYRRWADPLLRQIVNDKNSSLKDKLHASLALIEDDPCQVNFLYDQLLIASPEAMPVIITMLAPYQDRLKERLWKMVKGGSVEQRIRATAALAKYDPENKDWQLVKVDVVTALVSVPSVEASQWINLLQPLGRHLVEPLEARYRDRTANRDSERPLVAAALANYLAKAPQQLVELVLSADSDGEFLPLVEALRPHQKSVFSGLRNLLKQSPPNGGKPGIAGDPKSEIRDAFWKKQANAAVCLLQLGEQEEVWPLLKLSENPSLRSFIIDRLPKLGADFGTLAGHLVQEADVSIRQGLVLALGHFDPGKLSNQQRQSVIEQLLTLYRTDPDPGVHSAVAWALRQWQEEKAVQRLDAEFQEAPSRNQHNWFVNSQGQTFVVVNGPGKFQMGDKEEGLREVMLKYRFVIAANEVTVEQFQKFRPKQAPGVTYAPKPVCPMNEVSWFDAAAYCNWLNQQEKPPIPREQWCYEPVAEGEHKGEYAKGMRIPADFLQRTGYRLPTEAEWEYACRATTTSTFCFGEPVELLDQYSWYEEDSHGRSWPVGVLRPNGLGLFDMHGNLWEWCHDLYDSKNDDLIVEDGVSRVLRGGAFDYPPVYVRSAYRNYILPDNRFHIYGFRPARTYP